MIYTFNGHLDYATQILFTKNNHLISVGYDNAILVWDIETKQCLATLKEHNLGITGIAFLDISEK